MSDSELFELCKAVYERTGWTMTDFYIPISEGMIPVPTYTMYPEKIGYGKDNIPLYTSDYLLEKLPNKYNNGVLLVSVTNSTQWGAEYYSFYPPERGAKTEVYIAGTPLKALLKLTLALSDAGIEL